MDSVANAVLDRVEMLRSYLINRHWTYARKGQGLELVMQLGSERSGQECSAFLIATKPSKALRLHSVEVSSFGWHARHQGRILRTR